MGDYIDTAMLISFAGSQENTSKTVILSLLTYIFSEFGIIEDIGETQEYSYDPEKYQCVCIDDAYIDDWWKMQAAAFPSFISLALLLRMFLSALSGTSSNTLYDSLPGFQEIMLSDKRINEDVHLRGLADKIQDAISRNIFRSRIISLNSGSPFISLAATDI